MASSLEAALFLSFIHHFKSRIYLYVIGSSVVVFHIFLYCDWNLIHGSQKQNRWEILVSGMFNNARIVLSEEPNTSQPTLSDSKSYRYGLSHLPSWPRYMSFSCHEECKRSLILKLWSWRSHGKSIEI